uniref:Uncharacterized protein n=1 Tax=Anguilla anguilla TaxID=7936 RepID=A0A0E9UKC0_ANGAN
MKLVQLPLSSTRVTRSVSYHSSIRIYMRSNMRLTHR